MEVMVSSSFGIGMAACVRNRTQDKAVPAAALFLPYESRRGGSNIGLASRIGLRMSSKSPVESSEDSSSSIGESSDNDEEEVDDAVSFQGRGGGAFDSLSSSLEDCLPIKRGLSNYYVGKSKSFGNLMEASNSNAKDLEKAENPFNKRRRLLIANKLRSIAGRSISASSFYTWQNPNSMPLLTLQEHNEVDDHNDDDDDYEENDQTIKLLEKRKMMMMNKRDLMAQTQSCFCLSSLQEEEDGDGGGGDDDDADE